MEVIHNFLNGLSYYRYPFVFLLAIVEGPMVMVACGILLKLKFFYFWPVYFSLLLGDFVADLGWYAVGYYGARRFVDRFGRYFSLTPQVMDKLEEVFKRHHDKILFISKITMGLGFALATLITAGMVRVNFKKYAIYNFLGGFIWTGLLLAVGFFFGNLYAPLNAGLKIVFVVVLVIIVSAVLYGGGRYFKGLLLKNKI